MDEEGAGQPRSIVRSVVGDETVLCVIVAAGGGLVTVVNSDYPQAEAHARRHIAAGFGVVQVCAPDCTG